MWAECPRKYKLNYIDNLGVFRGNIHTLFGQSIHEVLQHYLDVFYNVTKKAANEIDLNALLLKTMREEFAKMHTDTAPGEYLISRKEIEDFYWDGVQIIKWFTNGKNQAKFFVKKNHELVGIEKPINIAVRENINVIGFIDVIIRNTVTGTYTIIDFKTSTYGWNKYAKQSDQKRNQILLYKKWYAEQYGVPIDKINVEFHIMRRKMPDNEEDLEYVIPRVSKFVPAAGSVSMNRANRQFEEFLTEVFDSSGNHLEKEYPMNPGKMCQWCDFYGKYCTGGK